MPIVKSFSLRINLIVAAGMLAFAILAPVPALAQTDPFGVEDAARINVGEERDLKFAIANIVNVVLGFLGILAVIIIMYAGFKWMTASGNEEQVGEARKMLLQAVIGLIIIMGAWVIINFVTGEFGRAVQLEN
ncbi:MAG: hypothetical protein HYT31_04800 [Parcubacteria group bacterium]|nr:hypothetical protein [Parcubacteria group bacterium]